MCLKNFEFLTLKLRFKTAEQAVLNVLSSALV